MSKHKHAHDIGRGVKAVRHGQRQAIGPLFNVRHPKKFKPVQLDKEAARSDDTTTDGKETRH